MAVHNGEKYLGEAIDSTLAQTFTDFEFIIVDDGSTDNTTQIIQGYNDERIRMILNDENIGLTRSLNKGLELARGEYIARMDSDDVSLPDRLAKQVAFMDANHEVSACGTWALDIDQAGKVVRKRETPVGDQLEKFYWRTSPLIHPTAMFRFSPSVGPWYDETFLVAQDYDLWLRIRAGQKLSNLPEYLLLYRTHDESITAARAQGQSRSAYAAFCKHIGGNKIPYESFLSLQGSSIGIDPLRRAFAMGRLARRIRKPYRVFFTDDLLYARRWVHSLRIYKVAFGSRGFRAFCNSIMRPGPQKGQS
jgi:glycosyltransferase involved in cell wall biosynthesis